jgi:outer membrane murein-binding lipoprotein Lpp
MKALLGCSVLASMMLAGCASHTLGRDECRTVDWRTLGYEDGVAGRSGEQIGRHRQSCAEHGVAPDLDAYRAGRAEGLREFCQPRNGYRAGASGQAYYDSCPPDLAPAFVAAYDQGRELYTHERRVYDADEDLTAEQRTQALLDAKQAGERIGRLKAEIAELERDRARYAQELESLRTTVASRR